MLIVNEEILTAMDTIVEEHKCIENTCKMVIESSYSGTEPHEQPLFWKFVSVMVSTIYRDYYINCDVVFFAIYKLLAKLK